MTNSLLTGASGLLSHQQKLDVVANNIANLNTTGYKNQSVVFSDLIYTNRSSAVGPSGTESGGVNPIQVGNGVQIAEVTQNFNQGVLAATGSDLDFAIDGDGFFVVEGEQQQFTRDGSFAIDSSGFLVDAATGLHVQRIGAVGETADGVPGFQAVGDTRVNIPLGVSVPGQATTSTDLIGNLPATAVPALTEVLTTASPLTTAGAVATGATLLNDLDLNGTAYTTGDTIEIIGTDVTGASFSSSFPVDATTTLADLTAAINGNLSTSSINISPEGNLLLTADEPGDALLSLQLANGDSNVGRKQFEEALFVIETDGKDPDAVDSTIQVFDSRGEPHSINVTFLKTGFNTWDAEFSPSDSSLTLSDNVISNIVFSEDGSFLTANDIGVGDQNISFTLDSLSGAQEIQFDLDNLTHLATNFSATFDQDGFSPGTLVSVDVATNGTLFGVASNGRRLDVAQLAIARFSNNAGLESIGNNYYAQTSNSGIPDVGSGLSNGRGAIRGGQLESSNVDVALEFTQLIIAQRGFSANARSITVATEILQELNNIL